MARAINKALAGEAFGVRHHDHQGDDYDPYRCEQCLPDLWVIYAIGVAFPQVDIGDLGVLRGMHGLSAEDIDAVLLDIECGGCVPPNLRYDWLAMRDRQADELATMRAELEPGCWYRNRFGRWVRDYDQPDPTPDPEIEELISGVREDQTKEVHAFFQARSPHPWLAPEASLLDEIRFGTDVRKARAAKRTALRKEMDVSCLVY